MTKQFLRCVLVLTAFFYTTAFSADNTAELALMAENSSITKPPNIVFILADDMGYDLVSVNNAEGMGSLRTPHIDQLAEQGMNFTDAHSGSSVCTPTRYGLLTGRYCWRTELEKAVLWEFGRPLIEDERLTLPEMLQRAGYATGMVGKWHLGFDWYDSKGNLANDTVKITDKLWSEHDGGAERIREAIKRIDFSQPLTGGPIDHGFDMYFGVDVPNFPPYAWISQDRLTELPTEAKPSEMFGTPGPMVPGWRLEDLLKVQARKSTAWIAEQAKVEQPFFLYLSLTSPHTPIAPSKSFQGKSVTPFADFVIETDWVVGEVMQALKDSGVADNTLVIFTTDNGTSKKARFNKLKKNGVDIQVNFTGYKAQIYEGGHRVPFIARWPGIIEAGTTNDDVIGLNDTMATIAEILDVSLPEDAAEDSFSILPLLAGQAATLPNRPAVIHHDRRGTFAIRQGKWKLVLLKNQPALYDMDADPKETTNLWHQYPEQVAQLEALLETYKTSGRSIQSRQKNSFYNQD
ncbi:MAG: arylsulfatase [Verrucomicrobiota bacterium]